MPPRKPKPLSLTEAVKVGHREGLEAMRDSLASAMELAEPAVVAQIAGRLQAVLDRLAEIAPVEEESLDDVLAARRAARESGAIATPPARRPGRQSG
jgi:hypothetical protein